MASMPKAYYWHDIHKEPQTLFNKQRVMASFIVWGAFFCETTDILSEYRQCFENYQKILELQLLPLGNLLGG